MFLILKSSFPKELFHYQYFTIIFFIVLLILRALSLGFGTKKGISWKKFVPRVIKSSHLQKGLIYETVEKTPLTALLALGRIRAISALGKTKM